MEWSSWIGRSRVLCFARSTTVSPVSRPNALFDPSRCTTTSRLLLGRPRFDLSMIEYRPKKPAPLRVRCALSLVAAVLLTLLGLGQGPSDPVVSPQHGRDLLSDLCGGAQSGDLDTLSLLGLLAGSSGETVGGSGDEGHGERYGGGFFFLVEKGFRGRRLKAAGQCDDMV